MRVDGRASRRARISSSGHATSRRRPRRSSSFGHRPFCFTARRRDGECAPRVGARIRSHGTTDSHLAAAGAPASERGRRERAPDWFVKLVQPDIETHSLNIVEGGQHLATVLITGRSRRRDRRSLGASAGHGASMARRHRPHDHRPLFHPGPHSRSAGQARKRHARTGGRPLRLPPSSLRASASSPPSPAISTRLPPRSTRPTPKTAASIASSSPFRRMSGARSRATCTTSSAPACSASWPAPRRSSVTPSICRRPTRRRSSPACRKSCRSPII